MLRLTRAEPDVAYACGGTATLRRPGRAGKRIAAAPFLFPHGVRSVEVAVKVPASVRRAGKRVAAAGVLQVEGRASSRARRVTLRR